MTNSIKTIPILEHAQSFEPEIEQSALSAWLEPSDEVIREIKATHESFVLSDSRLGTLLVG